MIILEQNHDIQPCRFDNLLGVKAGAEDRPLVILLHGFPDYSWGWRNQFASLVAQGFHVVAFDQRGYNLSDKPLDLRAYRLDELARDVLDVATASGSTTFRLVGHDWGGLVAWWTATRFPQRVRQLAVINAPHPDIWFTEARHHWKQALKSWYAVFFQLPWLPEAVLKLHDFALLRRAVERSARPGVFTPAVLNRYLTAWSQPGALTAMLNYYRAFRQRDRVEPERLEMPTLVIWGEQDPFLEKELARASLALCRAGKLVLLPHATHWPHLEEPALVNAALGEFFAERPRDV